MPMDSTDIKLVREILAAVRSGDEVTHKLLRAAREQHDKSNADLAKAFNRVADSLDAMTQELRALRQDLSPDLKKPKLSAPPKKSHGLDQGAA